MDTRQKRFDTVKHTSAEDRFEKRLTAMHHKANLRYQKQMFHKTHSHKSAYMAPIEGEVKGFVRVKSLRERQNVFDPKWFTMLRDNYWIALYATDYVLNWGFTEKVAIEMAKRRLKKRKNRQK
jgi:hypothetical protein